ncbi:leucine-rich repeats and immunoglobulin-like domains protein 2 [Palaemon carinicauda]|uniref:leucine-rich repeats and immunoglobulin-like domains protein 2 n=1 Tax=Palaemon carinicauda TaxID=392227 RepID=UPI0035B61363
MACDTEFYLRNIYPLEFIYGNSFWLGIVPNPCLSAETTPARTVPIELLLGQLVEYLQAWFRPRGTTLSTMLHYGIAVSAFSQQQNNVVTSTQTIITYAPNSTVVAKPMSCRRGCHVILGAALGTGLYMGPYFPTPQTRNITVHTNAVAYLPCAVKQLGDKSVSWVRQRDSDILTVDSYTFVRDERLTVHYTPSTETWTLVIKYVQERDAGTYECQISTEPKMSMWLHLNVIVPQVEIVGEVDKYIRKGSTTRLECKVSSTVQLPDYIFWYHSGERLLEYDNPRVKFSVSRRGGQGSEMSITSLLIISNTQPADEGNYTCLPSNLHSATNNLHVLNVSDEHPAAMQTGAAMLTDPPSTWGMMMVVLIAFIFVQVHHNFNLSTGAPGHGIVLARKTTSVGSVRSVTGNGAFHTTRDVQEDLA